MFLQFPNSFQGHEKCQRWIAACSRKNFTIKNFARNTYICVLHWPGEQGPTPEHPDPLKTNKTQREIEKASAPKRKPPTGTAASSKRQKLNFDSNDVSGTTQEIAENEKENFLLCLAFCYRGGRGASPKKRLLPPIIFKNNKKNNRNNNLLFKNNDPLSFALPL